jgi:hypothetical protein
MVPPYLAKLKLKILNGDFKAIHSRLMLRFLKWELMI